MSNWGDYTDDDVLFFLSATDARENQSEIQETSESKNPTDSKANVNRNTTQNADSQMITTTASTSSGRESRTFIYVPDSPEHMKKSRPQPSNKRVPVISLEKENIPNIAPKKEPKKGFEPPLKKTKTTTTTTTKTTTSSADSKSDEAYNCSICLEPWSLNGTHRICCLKCGHLFGKNCIDSWLKKSKTCPLCKAKSKSTDVRPLYNVKISAHDNSELDFALNQLKKEQRERAKIELEKSQLMFEHRIMKEMFETLKRDYRELERRVNEGNNMSVVTTTTTTTTTSPSNSTVISSSPSSQSSQPYSVPSMNGFFNIRPTLPPDVIRMMPTAQNFHTEHKYCMEHKISTEGARSLEWSGSRGLLVISSQAKNKNYGITKISALDPSNKEFIELSTKPIRDLKFCPRDDGLVLSASMDCQLKIVNTNTNNIVISYTLETPSQSCEWNPEDPNYFYCGQNKCILMFDIRKTNTYLQKLNGIQQTPAHSLHYVRSSTSDFNVMSRGKLNAKGLIVGCPTGIYFYDAEKDYQSTQLQLPGTCTSISFDPKSQYFLSSFRTTPTFNKPSHTIFEYAESGSVVKEIRTVHGHSPGELLTRSTLFIMSTEHDPKPSPTPQRLVAAAADEQSNQVFLWDVKVGALIQRLPGHSSPVLDVKHFGDNTSDFITTLSDKQLFIHRLK